MFDLWVGYLGLGEVGIMYLKRFSTRINEGSMGQLDGDSILTWVSSLIFWIKDTRGQCCEPIYKKHFNDHGNGSGPTTFFIRSLLKKHISLISNPFHEVCPISEATTQCKRMWDDEIGFIWLTRLRCHLSKVGYLSSVAMPTVVGLLCLRNTPSGLKRDGSTTLLKLYVSLFWRVWAFCKVWPKG